MTVERSEKNPFAKFLTHFMKGHVLFREGEDGEDMYIIQSGRVAIKKNVKDGDTTLAVLEKGDFFGEMAILERLPRSATAEIVEEGDLIVISGETFGDMIKANPEIAVRMLRKQSIRLRETNKQLEQVMAATGGGLLPAPPTRCAARRRHRRARCRPKPCATSSRGHGQRLPGLQRRGAHRPLRLGHRACSPRSTSPTRTRAATSRAATPAW